MKVVKLNSTHDHAVRSLFKFKKHMGVNDGEFSNEIDDFNDLLYNIFCDNYLSDLDNFHAYGAIDDSGIVQSLISFYESDDDPSWYYTLYRSSGNNQLLKNILDEVIAYNEKNGRLKFYTLVNSKHSKLLRRFTWSEYNSNRYGYFDEYLVPERCKPFYNTHWELLYKRILIPTETTVRCNYLKQELRTQLPIGGGI